MTTNSTEQVLYAELSYTIVGACFDVHNEVGRFAREKQYADRLEERFKLRNLKYEREFPLASSGNIVDFHIEEKIILELKTVRFLTRDYYQQIQNYLQQARIDLGLLVNFSDVFLRPRRILRIDTNKKQITNHSQSFVDSDSHGPIRT
jgi:GxxExxY protein